MVSRRAFLEPVAGAVLGAPLAARAQQAGKGYRVDFILTTSLVSEMVGRRGAGARIGAAHGSVIWLMGAVA